MMILFAAALAAAAAPAAPAQHDDAQPADHATMDCCKHMKADTTADCCKDVDAAAKAKCCAERAAGHAAHHQQ